jgi:lipoyl(octanoyl) transferase
VTSKQNLIVRALGRADYTQTWTAMRTFTDARTPETPDELWLVEHPPVYTMGLKGRDGTIADIGGIPLIYTDRGGDITYHGPGQIVLYPMLDLTRLGVGIKSLVQQLEQAIIDQLSRYEIAAARRPGAPGVYVGGKKIASLGLRVRRGCSYHGLACNVDMDLEPFARIDPCGYEGMEVTQLADLGVSASAFTVGAELARRLAGLLGYNAPVHLPERFESSPHE